MISSDEYSKRRLNIMEVFEGSILILPSYSNQKMSNDVDYEFRQQTDLMYFTGFPEPNSTALIEKINGKVKLTLFVPKRDPKFETWNGRRFGIEGAKNVFFADEAYNNEEFEERLQELIINYETVYYISGENVETDVIVQQQMHEAVKNRTRDKGKKGKGPINLSNPLHQIHMLRCIKSQKEFELIGKAAQISSEALKLAIMVTRPGLTEGQIESVVEYYFAKNHCDRPAYPTIAGSGVNATILHYIENSKTLKNGDLLLIDAGAEYKGYAADITRTWPVNGKFSHAQREIYDLVLSTQKKCIEMVKPGITLNQINDFATRILTEGLVKYGILEGEVDALIEEDKFVRFYMHRIGHFLGKDVHDTGFVNANVEPLKPNNYITIEPGIYIPDEEDIPKQYRGIGVRIEDDIFVTENGNKNLSAFVPKEIEEIEKLVGTSELP